MIGFEFDGVISSVEEKTTSKGTTFTVVKLTHEGKAFGKPDTTVVECTLPDSMKDEFPGVGTSGHAKVYMNSRDYNGRTYNGFRINSFEPTAATLGEPEAAPVDLGDELPF